MSKIVSIATAVPGYKHSQRDILDFMQRVYALNETDRRKLKFLYRQGGIETRFSVIPDYSLPSENWRFYPPAENLEPFATLEKRLEWYQQHAAQLSLQAITKCLVKRHIDITHLITVSCTGMSAPGLDIEMMEALQLPATIFHTSVNFMGCYAAIHALRMADAFCRCDKQANVLIVCTELCTLHFQKGPTIDNITSSMLFADGAAAVLVTGNSEEQGLHIDHFYSAIDIDGKEDMAWKLSSKGFLMTLSGYVPALIEKDFNELVLNALKPARLNKEDITNWCIHPGGRKILEAVQSSVGLSNGELDKSYRVLQQYGNMSSPTILFVLEKIMGQINYGQNKKIFGAAFGPGISMETFILSA